MRLQRIVFAYESTIPENIEKGVHCGGQRQNILGSYSARITIWNLI